MLSALRKEVGFRFISTVFDLIPIYAPHFFGAGFGNHFARYLMNTVEASDALLSISQSTTRDLEKFMGELRIPPVPVINFRLGDNPLDVIGLQSPRPEIRAGEFILVVGTVEVRKNHQVLYQAWELARKTGVELPQLVIVGRPGWNVNDLLYDISANPLVSDKIKIISGIEDADLGWLYANCILTVYPSWYEGWGLPVAESLHFGKLCISSDASSMPEIGGDLVEYCSPYEPAAFLEKILHFTSDPQALQHAEARIAASYTSVTWRETYEEIKRGLEQLSRDIP
ncbi:MAG: glycosyltransferase family 4 protein [Actinomycetales bacterium]|nr:glycosyltransferase family 4 protein [Actinomycetales bacterium]